MAIVHRATLTPTKLELLEVWLPSQEWFTAAGPLERETFFRYDDPDGEVGVETLVLRSGDALFHVPVTYRSAPLAGGRLIGEMEHSALGHRWVYDAETDPVYATVTRAAIVERLGSVDFFVDGEKIVPEGVASAVGSGIRATEPTAPLHLARRLPAAAPAGSPTLDAIWPGHDSPVTVAWLG